MTPGRVGRLRPSAVGPQLGWLRNPQRHPYASLVGKCGPRHPSLVVEVRLLIPCVARLLVRPGRTVIVSSLSLIACIFLLEKILGRWPYWGTASFYAVIAGNLFRDVLGPLAAIFLLLNHPKISAWMFRKKVWCEGR